PRSGRRRRGEGGRGTWGSGGDGGRALAGHHLLQVAEELAVVVLERPPAAGLGGGRLAGGQPGRVEHVGDRGGQLAGVVRVPDDQPILGRRQLRRGPVVLRRDDRQPAGEGLQGDERARVVEG